MGSPCKYRLSLKRTRSRAKKKNQTPYTFDITLRGETCRVTVVTLQSEITIGVTSPTAVATRRLWDNVD